jgi:hypothetical protein
MAFADKVDTIIASMSLLIVQGQRDYIKGGKAVFIGKATVGNLKQT